MKLSFRDLKQTRFTVDAEPADTIKTVKQKITEVRTEWDPQALKFIYSGKILQDDKTVESYNIEEKGYIVCMVQKPKQPAQASTSKTPSTPAVPKQSTSTTTAAAQAPQRNATSSTAAAEPATPSPAARSSTAAAPAAAGAAETGAGGPLNDNALLVGAASQSAIAEMEAMGFPRDMATRAMRAAFFNPDRAIEYLLNGIPESAERALEAQSQQQQQTQQQAASQSSTTQSGNTGAPIATIHDPSTVPTTSTSDEPVNLFDAARHAQNNDTRQPSSSATAAAAAAAGLPAAPNPTGAPGEVPGGILSFLRENPHFRHLRTIVQQQPQMLEPILQTLGTGNPGLAQMIASHQEEFLQLLSEDGDEGMEGGEMEGLEGPIPGAGAGAGQTTIAVTEEERDAIERLCNLGFSRDSVIQAYFACDKNEELAANFLFDQPDDDEP